MTVNELKEIVENFINNEFTHLRSKVDAIYGWLIKLFIATILILLGIIANLFLG